MSTCRFCKQDIFDEYEVKYGRRHYAHPACYLKAGKSLDDLHLWQVKKFPVRAALDAGIFPNFNAMVAYVDEREKKEREALEARTAPRFTVRVTHGTDGWLSFQAGTIFFQLPREDAEELRNQLNDIFAN